MFFWTVESLLPGCDRTTWMWSRTPLWSKLSWEKGKDDQRMQIETKSCGHGQQPTASFLGARETWFLETEVRVADRYLHEAGNQWDLSGTYSFLLNLWFGHHVPWICPGKEPPHLTYEQIIQDACSAPTKAARKLNKKVPMGPFMLWGSWNGTNWTGPKFWPE